MVLNSAARITGLLSYGVYNTGKERVGHMANGLKKRRTNQYATYATQSSGNPAYRPSQNTILPMRRLRFIAGVRLSAISGICTSYCKISIQ